MTSPMTSVAPARSAYASGRFSVITVGFDGSSDFTSALRSRTCAGVSGHSGPAT